MTKADTLHPDWIAVDWGTSNLRAWAMGPGGVLAEASSPDGMGRLAPGQFEAALIGLIGGWLPLGRVTQVVAAGMVGARQGWVEAPYRAVPCPPLNAAAAILVPCRDARLDLRILPGLSQSAPADVMRGEEVQIAGAMALGAPDGVICLPGTHSKWVQVSAGEVVGFQTCMTGEVFALLSEQSVLRHGMANQDWDDAAFDAGVAMGVQNPERLLARLFGLRAEGLLHALPAAAARARLSGLLIGAELAACKGWWLGLPVTLVGTPALCGLYARSLSAQGVTARTFAAADCTLAGLIHARHTMDAR